MTTADKAPRDALIQTQTTAVFVHAVQAKLNEGVIGACFDSIATVVSCAEEPAVPKFQDDGIAFRSWRSLVWAYAYEQLVLVLAGGVNSRQSTVEAFLLNCDAGVA